MPSTDNSAVLLQLEAFIAVNNIRRSVFQVVSNAQATNANISERSFNLPAGQEELLTGLASNKCTVIRVSKPVKAILTNAAGSLEVIINSLFVHSDNLTSIKLSHTATGTISQVRILQC